LLCGVVANAEGVVVEEVEEDQDVDEDQDTGNFDMEDE
jgi:hypothetical protein